MRELRTVGSLWQVPRSLSPMFGQCRYFSPKMTQKKSTWMIYSFFHRLTLIHPFFKNKTYYSTLSSQGSVGQSNSHYQEKFVSRQQLCQKAVRIYCFVITLLACYLCFVFLKSYQFLVYKSIEWVVCVHLRLDGFVYNASMSPHTLPD